MFNQEDRLTPSRLFRDSPADSGRDTPQKNTPHKSGKDTPGRPRPEKKPLSRQDSARRDTPDAPAPAARQLSELLQAKSQAVRGDVADKLNKLPTVVVHQVGRSMTGEDLCSFCLQVSGAFVLALTVSRYVACRNPLGFVSFHLHPLTLVVLLIRLLCKE